MIDKYCMIQFIESPDPDSVSIMYRMDGGEWVKHSDAQEKIDMLRDGLKHLRHSKSGSMEQYNNYVDNLLEVTR